MFVLHVLLGWSWALFNMIGFFCMYALSILLLDNVSCETGVGITRYIKTKCYPYLFYELQRYLQPL